MDTEDSKENKKTALRQKLHAMKMKRTSRNTIIKKMDKQKEKQENIIATDTGNEQEEYIDSELPPLEDY